MAAAMNESCNPALLSSKFSAPIRRAAKIFGDLSVLAVALVAAYALRFDFEIPPEHLTGLRAQLPIVLIMQILVLRAAGAQRTIWRYMGLADLPVFIKAAIFWTVPLLASRLLFDASLQRFRLPLSVILLDTFLALAGLLMLRVVTRSFFEQRDRRLHAATVLGGARRRVLLVGAGRAGVLSVREIRSHGDMDLDPVGFVDDDPFKANSVIGGVPVLGVTDDLRDLVERYDIDHVVITIAEADPTRIRHIVDVCERIPIKVRTIPGYYDLLQGNVSIQRIRDVDPDDLLGRDTVDLDVDDLRDFLSGKCIMVTGAGGSIGSELARQIARFRPSRLLLVERSEYALFEIERKLTELWPELDILLRLGDVCDEHRMRGLLEYHKPDVVLHAAAHKHVTMMEKQPAEAIKNNVDGTATIGELSGALGVGTFVLISTDKAVRPTSVMGASKRVAELIVQDLDSRYATKFMTVRFGNVLGSTGSVVPIFTEQIARGGPVTVTHRDMTRYFMSITEAAQLVLSAAAIGEGGEIFVLDMGEPMSIVELAQKMIQLSGFEPYDDIDIVFTGTRPGEKLTEQLGNLAEDLTPTTNAKIFIGKLSAYDSLALSRGVSQLRALALSGDSVRLRAFLSEFLPEANLEAATFRGGDEFPAILEDQAGEG